MKIPLPQIFQTITQSYNKNNYYKMNSRVVHINMLLRLAQQENIISLHSLKWELGVFVIFLSFNNKYVAN